MTAHIAARADHRPVRQSQRAVLGELHRKRGPLRKSDAHRFADCNCNRNSNAYGFTHGLTDRHPTSSLCIRWPWRCRFVGTANGRLFNGASVSAGQLHLDGVDDYVQFQEGIVPTVGDFSVAFFALEVSPQATYAEIISQGFSGGPGFYVGYDPDHNFRIGDGLLFTGIPFPSDGFSIIMQSQPAVTPGSTSTGLSW